LSWADNYIANLRLGQITKFRPRGNSMVGLINSGDLVTIEPIGDRILEKNDIVLCKVKGNIYLHKITACDYVNELYQIGNNRGVINGWTSKDKIYGICVKVET